MSGMFLEFAYNLTQILVSEDAPYVSLISLVFNFLLNPSILTDRRIQKTLQGAALSRAKAVLKVASKKFNLQSLITEENLKRVGILSDRVGNICKFKKFKNGIVVPSSSFSNSENENSDFDEGTQTVA